MSGVSRKWIVAAAVMVSLLVNVGLIGVASLLSRERALPQDLTDPIGVGLINLSPPEPPQEEEETPPEPPKPQPQDDFSPDIVRPELSGPGTLEGGIAINVGGLGDSGLNNDFAFESYELDQAPQPVVKTAPVYPFRAREQGIEGVVQVKILVNADGSVGQIQIMAARPENTFEDAVMQAVAQWRFRPGTIEGKAVTAWVVTALKFQLN